MSAGGPTIDRAIYEIGPAYADNDAVADDQAAAQRKLANEKDIEKKEGGAGALQDVDVSERTIADLRRTEETYDPNASSAKLTCVFGYSQFPDDVYPTDEEKATLRRVADSVPIKAYAIAFVELCERFSYYGATQVFTNFIQQPLPPGSKTGAGGHYGQSGALGQGQQASTGLTTFNSFWNYVTPLWGGWLADSRWGRYPTIQRGIYCALVGHILWIISAIPPVIVHSNGAMAALCIGIVINGLGTGCFKPNISPLIAEQYKRKLLTVKTLKSGEKVILDPAMTVARIYMYFYLMINFGALGGQIGMVYVEKYVGFWLSYTLPTAVYCLAPLVMYFGKKYYVLTPPVGSTLPKTISTIRMACRGKISFNPIATYKRLSAPDFWDTARPETYSPAERPEKLTWDSAWVNEVSRGLAACKVAIYFPIYWLPYNQIINNLTSQSAVLNTHGAPNDLINNIDPIAIIILVPICDLVAYPTLRRFGISVSPIRRIFWGFMFAALAMLLAAIVQWQAYKQSPCGYQAATCTDADGNALVADINVWVQTPIYFFIGLSEVLASITSLEYAYTKAPKSMRGMVQAIFLLTTAIANAITEAFVPISVDPYLIWNYGSMAVLALIGGVAFFFTFRKLDADEDRLNDLKQGQVDELHHSVATKAPE